MKVIQLELKDRDHAAIEAQAKVRGVTVTEFISEKVLSDIPETKERVFGQLKGKLNLPDGFFEEDPEVTALFYGEKY